MASYTGSLTLYQSFNKYKGDGTIDLDDATAGRFKIMLTTNSYVPNASTHTVKTDVTNELSAAGGYAAQSLTNVVWTQTGAVMKWDFDNPAWTASGANFDAARYFVIFDDLSVGVTDALIAFGEIDSTPADVTVTDGTTLTLQINSGGLVTDTIT